MKTMNTSTMALLLIVVLAGCQSVDGGNASAIRQPGSANTSFGLNREGDPITNPYLAWQRE